MNGIVTNWTFPPRMVGQRQIMKNTWPAKYMTTSCNFGCFGWIQANRTAFSKPARRGSNEVTSKKSIGLGVVIPKGKP